MMKKFILLIGLLGIGLTYSQIPETQKTDPNTKKLQPAPYFKLDKTDKQRQAPSRFYKNIDSGKASRYKMLNKKPGDQFLELPHTKLQPQPTQKPKDSTQPKKK